MAKPKFDYNADDFYDEILALSMQGLTDAEIADSLSDKFDNSLSPEVFSTMKNGKYSGWNKKDNEVRSAKISKALARGRRKINSIVRGSYLKNALGGKKIKGVTRIYTEVKCDCKGTDPKCKFCFGTGRIVSEKKAIIQETEQELAPNVQALSTWLFNHDDEWREKTVQKVDVTTNGQSLAPQKVNLEIVYNKKEDLDIQEKSIS